MLPCTFNYSNPFRSLDVYAAYPAAGQDSHEWTPSELDDNFYVEPLAAGFGTGQDVDYEVTVAEAGHLAVSRDCYSAVVVPLKLENGFIYIRGGYTDKDIWVPTEYAAVGFFEMPKQKIVLNLYRVKPVKTGVLRSSKDLRLSLEYDEAGLIAAANWKG